MVKVSSSTYMIECMIKRMCNEGCYEKVELKIEYSIDDDIWTVKIVEDDHILTLESDSSIQLISESNCLPTAIEILDDICRKDF